MTVGPHMPMPMWLISGRDPGPGELLPGDRLLHQRAALAAVLARPRDADQAGVGEHPLRRAELRLVGGRVEGLARRDVQQVPGVLLEQTPHVRPVLGFLGTVVEVHRQVLSSACGTAAA